MYLWYLSLKSKQTDFISDHEDIVYFKVKVEDKINSMH